MIKNKTSKKLISNYLSKVFCLLIILLLTACSAKDKYNKKNQKVILGRITVMANGKNYNYAIPDSPKTFVRQPWIAINPFVDDTRGKGLIIANAYEKNYKIEGVHGKHEISSYKAKFPAININVGEEKGIYYFGYLRLVYVNGVLVDIQLTNQKEKDLKDAKKYLGRDAKRLNVFDITNETQKEIDRIVEESRKIEKQTQKEDEKTIDEDLKQFENEK